MQSLVVFLAVAAVARASLLVEPYGYPFGYSALSQYAYSIPAVVGPSAVSHQSRVDISSSPAVVSESYATPLLAASPIWGHAHLLKKRSLGYLGHYAYSTPIVAQSITPSAVSHQSRVDIKSSPAVVSEEIVAAPVVAHTVAAPVVARTVAAPVFAHTVAAPVVARTVAAPVVAHAVAAPVITQTVGASAVSHQSRVDVQSSPAVVSESYVAGPAVTYSSNLYAPYAYGLQGHILKKRSLGYLGNVAYSTPIVAHSISPSAVSHQSRVDYKSSPAIVSEEIVAAPVVARTVAAPVVAHAVATPVVAQAIAPSAVSHQSRVEYKSSPAIVSEQIVAAPVVARTVAAPVVAHAIAPSAVSHQSRVDYKSSPAVVSESVVSAPVFHSAAIAAPINAYSLYGW